MLLLCPGMFNPPACKEGKRWLQPLCCLNTLLSIWLSIKKLVSCVHGCMCISVEIRGQLLRWLPHSNYRWIPGNQHCVKIDLHTKSSHWLYKNLVFKKERFTHFCCVCLNVWLLNACVPQAAVPREARKRASDSLLHASPKSGVIGSFDLLLGTDIQSSVRA